MSRSRDDRGPGHRRKAFALICKAAERGERIHQVSIRLPGQSQNRLDIAVMVLGAKTLTALEAMRVLLPVGIDDQLAVIGRSQADTAIDMLYLLTATTRSIGRGRSMPALRLTPETKADLFITHVAIHVAHVIGESSDPPLPGLTEARELRERLGLPSRSPFWHCGRAMAPLQELEAELGEDSNELKTLRFIYAHLSAFAHPHPHISTYLSAEPIKDLPAVEPEEIHDPIAVEQSLLAAIKALGYWAHHLATDSIVELEQALEDLTRCGERYRRLEGGQDPET